MKIFVYQKHILKKQQRFIKEEHNNVSHIDPVHFKKLINARRKTMTNECDEKGCSICNNNKPLCDQSENCEYNTTEKKCKDNFEDDEDDEDNWL